MKNLSSVIIILMLSQYTYALGDSSVLKNSQSGMTDTVSSLNQFSKEEEETDNMPESVVEPQDAQEEQYQEDLKREEQEWDEAHSLEEYRYDVP